MRKASARSPAGCGGDDAGDVSTTGGFWSFDGTGGKLRLCQQVVQRRQSAGDQETAF